MVEYEFECPTCKTSLKIKTSLNESDIHKVPPCPCGFSRMDLVSIKKEKIEYDKLIETNLGIEEMENPNKCLCLDCVVTHNGL